MKKLENLSNKELEAIKELEKRTKSLLTKGLQNDQTVYYRFLKARDFDVDNAEKMLLRHITFRKVYQYDTILEDFTPLESFLKFAKPVLLGYDKEGNAVAYSPTGKIESNDIMKCMTMSTFMKHWMWLGEVRIALLKEENERTGREASQAIVIIDLENLTFSNATAKASINMFLEFSRVYQDNYPERMKATYVINAPSYYVIGFAILKRFMSSDMLKKIYIFGNSGWKEKLLEEIDADVLPAFLGGNKTDPDGNPLCKTFVTHGGKIPEYYFATPEERYFTDKSKVQKITLLPKEKREMCVHVEVLGVRIKWEFYVKNRDIEFGLFYEASENNVTEVLPLWRYSTPDGAEKGSFKCRETGKYIVIFDNSHSWFTPKEVDYCITVECAKL